MPTHIPYELVTAIVQELADNIFSLKACSLAAVAFCSPSQRLLLEYWSQSYTTSKRALHWGTSVPSGTVQRASRLLKHSPYIAAYIRDLSIDLPGATESTDDHVHVLQILPNLERLMICGLVHFHIGTIRTAIFDLLSQPKLDRLHLLYIRELPHVVLLRALFAVRVLSLSSVKLPEADFDVLSNVPVVASRLEQLTPQLRSLTQLSLRINPASSCFEFRERLLATWAGTLQQLNLDFEDSFEPPLILPNLPKLRRIGLCIFSSPPSPTRPSLRLLDVVKSLPRVSLTIDFFAIDFSFERPYPLIEVFSGLDCLEMDEIYCRLAWVNPVGNKAAKDRSFKSFCDETYSFSRGQDMLHKYVGRLL
ncbi:hypothetical protein C8J57DRAFT_1291299 [Mycena rebaudengoi]|nr:hypothetical protein C8J57DRAFT_1291299 [Mycena rebaudengoi]